MKVVAFVVGNIGAVVVVFVGALLVANESVVCVFVVVIPMVCDVVGATFNSTFKAMPEWFSDGNTVYVGSLVGAIPGTSVGIFEGLLVGVVVGIEVGMYVGLLDGVIVCTSAGTFDGLLIGSAVLVGKSVGIFAGSLLGAFEGTRVGMFNGTLVGGVVGN